MKTQENIVEQWNNYVSNYKKANFGEFEWPVYRSNETLDEKTDYIIRSINNYLSDNPIEIPLTREFSGKGMTEFQKLIFLTEETERALFPEDNRFMCSIIYDEYNIEHGIQGLYDIIGRYVKWVDCEG